MARYVLMQPPEGSQSEAVIVRDAFSVFALIVPVVWLLWHRMWLAALLAFSLLVFGVVAAWYFAMPPIALALDLLVSAYVALEGPALRVSLLQLAGWREAGVVAAPDRNEAEMRLLAGLSDQQVTMVTQAKPVSGAAHGTSAAALPFAFPSRG
jgi:hypothetical protein